MVIKFIQQPIDLVLKNFVTSAFHAVWKRHSDGKWKFEELNGCPIIIVLYPR